MIASAARPYTATRVIVGMADNRADAAEPSNERGHRTGAQLFEPRRPVHALKLLARENPRQVRPVARKIARSGCQRHRITPAGLESPHDVGQHRRVGVIAPSVQLDEQPGRREAIRVVGRADDPRRRQSGDDVVDIRAALRRQRRDAVARGIECADILVDREHGALLAGLERRRAESADERQDTERQARIDQSGRNGVTGRRAVKLRQQMLEVERLLADALVIVHRARGQSSSSGPTRHWETNPPSTKRPASRRADSPTCVQT